MQVNNCKGSALTDLEEDIIMKAASTSKAVCAEATRSDICAILHSLTDQVMFSILVKGLSVIFVS